MKQCRNCKIKKPLTEFVIARATKSGYKSYCKKCHSEREKRRHWENRDKLIIKMRERYNRNKDELNKKKRERYATDKAYGEHLKELSRKSGLKNKEKKAIYMKDYHKKNKEKRLDYLHKYQDENRETIYEQNRIYRKTESGKKAMAKHYNKRKRELGFNILFENEIIEEIDWHHVNNEDVVAVPRDLHTLYGGGNGNTDIHRQNLEPIIIQLYPEYGVDNV